MDLTDTSLEQVGSSARGHYTVAEKAEAKAEEHYKSCGIYLKHAKLRVLKIKGLTWEKFLKDHFSIEQPDGSIKILSRRRSDEIIAIGDGSKTLEQLRETNKNKKRKSREKAKEEEGDQTRRDVTPDCPEKVNENNEGVSTEGLSIGEQALLKRKDLAKSKIDDYTPQQMDLLEKSMFHIKDLQNV